MLKVAGDNESVQMPPWSKPDLAYIKTKYATVNAAYVTGKNIRDTQSIMKPKLFPVGGDGSSGRPFFSDPGMSFSG